ncbi:MAG: peptidase M28 family protein, partial [Bacteroidota bacterium]
MIYRIAFIIFSFLSISFAQPVSTPYDSLAQRLFTTALSSNKSIETLTELTTTVGHRLSGSPQAARAVEWSKKKM